MQATKQTFAATATEHAVQRALQAAPNMHTVAVPSTLRTTRVAKVQVALHARYIAAKHAKYVQATNVANTTAYNLAVQQLAAQYGVTVPANAQRTLNGSATNIAPKHAPSAQTGSCALVHQLAAANGYNRKATLAAAAAAGINPATAATQYNVARKAHLLVAATPAPAQ